MNTINHIYIDGAFVNLNGKEEQALFNPASGEKSGTGILGDETDVEKAVIE